MSRSLLLASLFLSTTALAVPLELTHQGRLLDSTGAVVVGPVDLTVSLFDAPSGGSTVWSDTFTDVPLDEGYYSLVLGTGTEPLEADDFDTGDSLFVELAVDGGTPLPARLPLTSVPWAIHAGSATSVTGGAVSASTVTADSVTTDAVSAGSVQVGGQDVVTNWSGLPDVPADLADGDADTLGDVTGCTNGQVVKSDGSGGWACADDGPSDADIRAAVAGGTVDLAADATIGGAGIATTDLTHGAQTWAHSIHIKSVGYGARAIVPASTVAVDGTVVQTTGRSYGLVVIDRATGAVTSEGTFDVYGDATEADRLATVLSGLDSTKIIVLNTHDEPANNRLSGTLPDELMRCGASGRFSGPWVSRPAYALVGICDAGPGSGSEFYAGDVGNSPTAFLETVVELQDGAIVSPNTGNTATRFYEKNNVDWSTGAINPNDTSVYTLLPNLQQTITVTEPSLLIMTANGHINGPDQDGQWAYVSFYVTPEGGTAASANAGGSFGQYHIYSNLMRAQTGSNARWGPVALVQMHQVPAGTHTVDVRVRQSSNGWTYNGMGMQIAAVPMR